jgi:hypothetical protein
MKKRDYKTGIEISNADWQRFEKFFSHLKHRPIRGCKIIAD